MSREGARLTSEDSPLAPYPDRAAERDRWILARRPAREKLDPRRPYGFFLESEPDESGRVVPVATLYLTNRECPWRCLMCDLWRNTLTGTVAPGDIPEQIRFALSRLAPSRHVKLYNSGSFFDPRAIPPEDYPPIARLLRLFERIIVESHPALVGAATLTFRDLLTGRLEVAVGLETIHPDILARLNKQMSLDQFRRAAAFLRDNGVALRVFLLVGLPFASRRESLEWTRRSIDYAFDCGATAVSLIPTRAGNGALDALEARGEFLPPTLAMLEKAASYGLRIGRGRVLADLWDLQRLARCSLCFSARSKRLHRFNLEQAVLPVVECTSCAGESGFEEKD